MLSKIILSTGSKGATMHHQDRSTLLFGIIFRLVNVHEQIDIPKVSLTFIEVYRRSVAIFGIGVIQFKQRIHLFKVFHSRRIQDVFLDRNIEHTVLIAFRSMRQHNYAGHKNQNKFIHIISLMAQI